MENDNRSRILQAARDLFNTRGYRSVTVQDLAEKLGMSKKTIYQYFSGKEEIAAAAVEESMDKIRQALSVSKLPQADPVFVIKEIFIHAKDEATRFGPLFRMDMEKYLPSLANRYKEFRQEKTRHIEQLLQHAHSLGLVKDIPIPLLMEVFKQCLRAVVQSQLQPDGRYSLEDKLELFLDIFCNGIAKQEASRINS